jgi:hypothetical protein
LALRPEKKKKERKKSKNEREAAQKPMIERCMDRFEISCF